MLLLRQGLCTSEIHKWNQLEAELEDTVKGTEIEGFLNLNTLKPLYSEHHRDPDKVSAMKRCPLYRCLTFFSKEMTFRSLTG